MPPPHFSIPQSYFKINIIIFFFLLVCVACAYRSAIEASYVCSVPIYPLVFALITLVGIVHCRTSARLNRVDIHFSSFPAQETNKNIIANSCDSMWLWMGANTARGKKKTWDNFGSERTEAARNERVALNPFS